MPRARRQPQPGRRPDARRNHVPLVRTRRMLPLSDTALHTAAGSERGRRSSRPSVSSRGTRTILKEPETRRHKNRGHLARNRQFESRFLQRRVCKPSVPREIRVAPEHIAGPGSKLGLAVRSPVSAFRWCHEDRLADEKKIFGRVRANPSKSDLHRTRSTTHTASGMLEVTPRVTAGTPGRRDRILPDYEGRGPRSAWMFSNSQL